MTNLLVYENGKCVKIEKDDFLNAPKAKNLWMQVIAPSENEIKSITEEFAVPEDFVRSALDDEERARIDHDDESGYSLIVFDIPVPQNDGEYTDAPYTTMPLAFIQKGNLLITVCLKDSHKFNEIKHGTAKKNILLESNKLLYRLLLSFSTQYATYLSIIDKTSSRIEGHLTQTGKADNYLLQLMKFKNALIYFSSSLRQNIIVTNKLLLQKGMIEDDIETLENIAVEIEQAFATCNLQRELMTETMSTFSNIVNNRLAERMRFLTIVTIILAIPTLIAGLWGMNIKLPLQSQTSLWSFWAITGIIIVACLLAVIWVIPNQGSIGEDKRKKRNKKR